MIYITGLVSLCIQIIVGVIDYVALTVEVNYKDELLKDLLKVELVVQVIEFIFYVWLISYFNKESKNLSLVRYLDWSITTPLMLITLSAFLNHSEKTSGRLSDFLSEHTSSIVKIVVLNGLMLLCGLISELGLLNPYISTSLGFIPFILMFKHIKDKFLSSSKDTVKKWLFYWFVFFWSLYGVFAVMKYTTKNTGYNILDIFSKNFFGIFLAYNVMLKSKKR
jgi:bacteriorhodopsin